MVGFEPPGGSPGLVVVNCRKGGRIIVTIQSIPSIDLPTIDHLVSRLIRKKTQNKSWNAKVPDGKLEVR